MAGALRDEGAEVLFIGGDRAEAELVPAAGFALHTISVEGLSRSNPARALRALSLAARAFLKARSLLGELKPDVVMGGGGYVAAPVGLAAISRRIPLVLTEADSHLGLTNRMLAPLSRRVCLSFPIAGRDGPRYLLTGRPTMRPQSDRRAARAQLGIAEAERCVLIFGGSLGARSINYAAIEAFSDPGFRVLHISGRRDYPELSSKRLSARYDLREYMDHDEFAAALSAADLVIARAGGSVFEIAAHGLPAILVPYPRASADHQTVNARWMSEAGGAIVLEDRRLDAGRLAAAVSELLADESRLAAMAAASSTLARPHAARDVASELLAAVSR